MPVDIKKPLKKVLPHLLQAQAANLNEADTVLRLIKVFEDVLGYDGMTDISREAEMKKKFVDVVLKVDGVIKLLVEAKAGGETLRDRHIEQAQAYAARNNYRWVLLTNGVQWHLYHLTFDEGIEYERAFAFDLSNEAEFDKAVEYFGLLHRSAIKKGELEDFWQHSRALSAASIGRVLMQEEILSVIRREIRREEGLLIDVEDLGLAIHNLFSPEAREQIGPMKIRRKRGGAKKADATKNVIADAETGEAIAATDSPPAAAGTAVEAPLMPNPETKH